MEPSHKSHEQLMDQNAYDNLWKETVMLREQLEQSKQKWQERRANLIEYCEERLATVTRERDDYMEKKSQGDEVCDALNRAIKELEMHCCTKDQRIAELEAQLIYEEMQDGCKRHREALATAQVTLTGYRNTTEVMGREIDKFRQQRDEEKAMVGRLREALSSLYHAVEYVWSKGMIQITGAYDQEACDGLKAAKEQAQQALAQEP